MPCRCHIVPRSVLERFAKDESLPKSIRDGFERTALLDIEQRKFRAQAVKVTSAARAIAPVAMALRASPVVTVFDCAHSTVLPGAPVSRPGTSADPTAKHVFDETTSLVAFYSQVFGRNSIDDAGMTLLSSIHYGINYGNAQWNGTQMLYGEGDGSILVDFSKSNDIIAHEMTHGITQYTLQLAYKNESGGLNESLSDCFGSMFRQWEARQDVTQADWLIGKDILGQEATARGYTCLRDMAKPDAQHCLNPQIVHYKDYTPGMDPHYSSGPPNLAFYTICMAVGGNSWDKVGKIWYTVLTGSGAKPTMKMKAFANRTRAVAAQLYPGDATLAGAVDAGWNAVGL